MSAQEFILLAGGLGTRLRSVVDDRPKALADVAGRPFLLYLLDGIRKAGFKRVILAIGYKGEMVEDLVGDQYDGLEIDYSREDEPLGTGGALWQALRLCKGERVFASNADTYVGLSYAAMDQAHPHADIVMSVRAVPDRARFGAIRQENGRLTGFEEKGQSGPGLINSGVYLLRRDVIERFPIAAPFSFEQRVLEAECQAMRIEPFVGHGPFIDIGTPDDYRRAQTELPGYIAQA